MDLHPMQMTDASYNLDSLLQALIYTCNSVHVVAQIITPTSY